ncbi:MAG: putative minor tail protein [Prokaryotic dsDNA virus sp.]|nr:MAG: putative minor tail protein [Prokaryotic dsDNA virus sp.]|tara:strand:- start:10032 stop:12431 length:2400 start_codon:yes stop_codon:yes gene_type:complete
MATEKSVKYNLRMKDSTSSVLGKVRKNIKTTQKSFRNFTSTLSQLTIISTGVSRAISKIGRTASTALQGTVGEFMQFEKGMAEVATITSLNAEEMANLGSEVQRFSREYAVDANEAAKALYMTISAGTDATNGGTKAFEVMGQAIKFGKAALVDASTSVDLMTTVLNSYGMEASDATKVSDILFSTIRLGKTTGEELSTSMGRITSIAAAAGVSFEDLSTAMVMLTRAGLSTDEATTSLRSLLVSIVKPTKQASDAISELGLTMFNEATLARQGGLFEVLEQLNEKAGDSVGTLGQVIPNIRALTAALASAGQQGDVPEILRDINNASGATETALQKMTATFSFRWEQLVQQFTSLRTRYGELIADSEVLSGTMQGISNAIEETIESLKEGGTASEDFGRIIDGFIETTIPALVRVLKTFVEVIGGIVSGLSTVFNHPWLGGDGSGAELATKATESLSNMFERLAVTIETAADKARLLAEENEVLNFQRTTISGKGLEEQLKVTSNAVEENKKSVEKTAQAYSTFEENINSAKETITKAGGMIPAISETAKEVQKVVHETDNVKWLFISIVEQAVNLRGIFGELGNTFSNSMTPALDGVSSFLDDLFDKLADWGEELSTKLQDAITGWYETKHDLEVADAQKSQDIHVASATQAAAITNNAIAQIMPSLSAAASAALIATQGGAQVHAGLLPALLAAAAAQGAAFAAFAEGGRVTSPTLALIGEAGAETIIPETRTGRARDVLSDLASRRPELFSNVSQGSASSMTSNNININVSGSGDSDLVAERIADEVDKILGRRI